MGYSLPLSEPQGSTMQAAPKGSVPLSKEAVGSCEDGNAAQKHFEIGLRVAVYVGTHNNPVCCGRIPDSLGSGGHAVEQEAHPLQRRR